MPFFKTFSDWAKSVLQWCSSYFSKRDEEGEDEEEQEEEEEEEEEVPISKSLARSIRGGAIDPINRLVQEASTGGHTGGGAGGGAGGGGEGGKLSRRTLRKRRRKDFSSNQLARHRYGMDAHYTALAAITGRNGGVVPAATLCDQEVREEYFGYYMANWHHFRSHAFRLDRAHDDR